MKILKDEVLSEDKWHYELTKKATVRVYGIEYETEYSMPSYEEGNLEVVKECIIYAVFEKAKRYDMLMNRKEVIAE